jgi:hypothetical protein
MEVPVLLLEHDRFSNNNMHTYNHNKKTPLSGSETPQLKIITLHGTLIIRTKG